MGREDIHLCDEDLLRSVDGELPAAAEAKLRAHLAACWGCRARMGQLERTISEFVQFHQENDALLPPPDRGRVLLKAHLAQLGSSSRVSWGQQLRSLVQQPRAAMLALCAVLVPVLFLVWWVRLQPADLESQAIPDPRLTPGVVIPVTREAICSVDAVEAVRTVPPAVALAVFAEYGIRKPRPGAYEVDYLISPALGGSDNLRNFWPQSYRNKVWNAHIKDALEDHLHHLVCSGEVDLTSAQQEISRNWIAAYQKYFHTDLPLAEHARFLRDRPWE